MKGIYYDTENQEICPNCTKNFSDPTTHVIENPLSTEIISIDSKTEIRLDKSKCLKCGHLSFHKTFIYHHAPLIPKANNRKKKQSKKKDLSNFIS